MTLPCDCCEGIQILTPLPTANRPGLDTLVYRVGTHAAFLETMKARLSNLYLEIVLDELDENGQLAKLKLHPLKTLRTRESNDPAIALLDAWAIVADVLTFYQERVANEGYLRTATERRSILELARLVGYRLRPGVASTVYLAYTLDQGYTVEIPQGARAQSIPNPGEQMQSFETSDPILARTGWNNLQPRLTQPQRIETDGADLNTGTLYLQGTTTNLKPNDPLLFNVFGTPIVRRVKTVQADFPSGRTKVTLQEAPYTNTAPRSIMATEGPVEVLSIAAGDDKGDGNTAFDALHDLIEPLSLPPSLHPAYSALLPRNITQTLDVQRDTLPQVLTVLKPGIASNVYTAWANTAIPSVGSPQVFALRVKATPFGSTAPLKPITDEQGRVVGHEEWPLAGAVTINISMVNRSNRTTVSITRNNQKQSATVTLADKEQKLTLGQDTVDITANTNVIFATTTSSESSAVISYNFQFVELGRKIVVQSVEPGQDQTQTVTIDDDGVQTVSPNETLEYSSGDRHVIITLSRGATTLTVEDVSPQAPDPCDIVFLDAQYDQIVPNSLAVIIRPDPNDANKTVTDVRGVTAVQSISKADYGITGKSTQLTLDQDWLVPSDISLSTLRGTTVYAQSEELQLAEEPYHPDQDGNPADVGGKTIELDSLYDGLQSGRWIVVSGERTDIPNTASVTASELVMLAGVQQTVDPTLPGDKTHSVLILANDLAYTYKRATATIYGNVVKATHGETKNEVLGNGDGSQTLQKFTLKSPPLTFVSAPTPAGAESTLAVYVNDVKWHESDSFVNLGPTDRDYITRTDDDDKTTVIFGDGKQGARLPTGAGNVKAVYRSGIGTPGNVKAGQITLLATKPLGVKQVVNPLPATGGADRESRDQARRNVPLATLALDRLVSTEDYADFARTFAGIGKASAARLSDGQRLLVHVTIAGADDIPIDVNSDLYQNLRQALRQYGDPYLPIQVALRELLLMVLSANIRVLPDYQWQSVEQNVREALLDAFSFERRDLGQPVFLSEVISRIQQVAGVAYVDVDFFGSIRENFTTAELEQLLQGNKINDPINAQLARRDPNATGPIKPILPAQLAYLTPDVPDTLILKEITQ